MSLCRIFFSAALIVLAPQVAPAGVNLSNFNLITTGDVADSSDVQGRVLVGGTLSTNSFTFGGHLSGSNLSPPAGIFNALGSNVNTLNNNGHNFIYGSGGPIQNSTVTPSPSAVAPYTSGLSSYLANVSSSYAGLSTAATMTANTINTTDMNNVSFNATSTTSGGLSNIAVFTVNQSFFQNNYTITGLNGINSNTTVLIDVVGGTPGSSDPVSFGSLHFNAFQGNEARILFNFENATSLTGLPNLSGSILAPNAILSTGNTLVGSVYVQGLAAQQGEIDRPFLNGVEVDGFQGVVPNVVPEPATVVSTLSGLAMAGGLAWRRRRRRAG